MDKYLINKNELLSFLRYEILYKWKCVAEHDSDASKFSHYLINETPYQPDSDFIQSLCETDEEHEDPIGTGIYEDILPGDVARYQLKSLYKPYQKK